MKYKVIDNFLEEAQFKQLQEFMMGHFVPWYYQPYVALPKSKDGLYFTHLFFSDTQGKCWSMEHLQPLIDAIRPHTLLRAKGNLYPGTKKMFEHDQHVDMPFKHKGFILSINTNNGYTRLDDGTKIKSVANRGLFFDSSVLHNSSTCTDQQVRVNINLNYME